MKIKFISTLIIIVFFIVGCKINKKEESQDVVDSTFKVKLRVIVKKDDDFSLFYTEDGSIDFKEQPIWNSVKGSENEQEVVYTLPIDLIPTQLRLDFGLKENQENIVLKSVTLDYFGKKRSFVGLELGNFFRADDSKCSFDPTTGIIRAVVKDGKREFPSLYPHEFTLGPEISKLVK